MEDSEDPSRAGTPVRAGTPKPALEKSERPTSSIANPPDAKEVIPAENGASTPNPEKTKGETGTGDKGPAESGGSPTTELPVEVRVKLRKFERLEATYTG